MTLNSVIEFKSWFRSSGMFEIGEISEIFDWSVLRLGDKDLFEALKSVRIDNVSILIGWRRFSKEIENHKGNSRLKVYEDNKSLKIYVLDVSDEDDDDVWLRFICFSKALLWRSRRLFNFSSSDIKCSAIFNWRWAFFNWKKRYRSNRIFLFSGQNKKKTKVLLLFDPNLNVRERPDWFDRMFLSFWRLISTKFDRERRHIPFERIWTKRSFDQNYFQQELKMRITNRLKVLWSSAYFPWENKFLWWFLEWPQELLLENRDIDSLDILLLSKIRTTAEQMRKDPFVQTSKEKHEKCRKTMKNIEMKIYVNVFECCVKRSIFCWNTSENIRDVEQLNCKCLFVIKKKISWMKMTVNKLIFINKIEAL